MYPIKVHKLLAPYKSEHLSSGLLYLYRSMEFIGWSCTIIKIMLISYGPVHHIDNRLDMCILLICYDILMYICEWTIFLYEESLFNKFLFNNCNLVCPQGPKLEIKLLLYYNYHRSWILANWFGLQTTSKSSVHAGTHWKVHIEQLLKDRTILSRSHTEMFIFKINLKSLHTHLV